MQVFGTSEVLLRLAKSVTKYKDQLKLLSEFNTFMVQLRDGDKDAERRLDGLLNVCNAYSLYRGQPFLATMLIS